MCFTKLSENNCQSGLPVLLVEIQITTQFPHISSSHLHFNAEIGLLGSSFKNLSSYMDTSAKMPFSCSKELLMRAT